jgi:hypothetical protein
MQIGIHGERGVPFVYHVVLRFHGGVAAEAHS